jgi:hypothetical protein
MEIGFVPPRRGDMRNNVYRQCSGTDLIDARADHLWPDLKNQVFNVKITK